jgi:hypothetical protein
MSRKQKASQWSDIIREQERSWYGEGIHALVLHLRTAIDVNVDYVEK